MDAATLDRLVGKSKCRVFGSEDAANEPQRNVLAVLIEGFDHPDATVLCEPSLARKTTRPPPDWLGGLVRVQGGLPSGLRHITVCPPLPFVIGWSYSHYQTLPPGSGVILAPNHADETDFKVCLVLSRRCGRRFLFMMNHEAFDEGFGTAGWWLQRLGAFSVERGGKSEGAKRLSSTP